MKRWKSVATVVLALGLSWGMAASVYAQVKETSSGNKIEGVWISDQQEGPGTIYYSDGSRLEGFWRHGVMEGSSISYETDGSRRIWTYFNGQANGLGVEISKTGEATAGMWEDHAQKQDASIQSWEDSNGTRYFAKDKKDINEGWAIAIYTNDEVYVGEFYEGKRNGWGALYDTDETWFMGSWKEDQLQGAGYFSFSKDSDALHKSGFFENGMFQGGTLQFNKDDSVSITWENNNKADGPTIRISSDGTPVFYECKDGKVSNSNPDIYTDHDGCRFIGGTDGKSGFGLRLMKSGSVYIGGFKDMKPHGQGFFYWPTSNNLFQGTFEENIRTEGTLIWPHGSYYTGTFWDDKANKMKTGTYRDFRKYEIGTCNAEGTFETGTRIRFNKDGSTAKETYKDGQKQE